MLWTLIGLVLVGVASYTAGAPDVITCAPRDKVFCFVEPCKDKTCPGRPNATCLNSFCTNPKYRGRPIPYGQCSAVWVNKNTGNIVTCPNPACSCILIYQPVCCGGKTYGNECEAGCLGLDTKKCTEGECPCVCTKEYKPVCCGGKTYGNACEAKCAGLGPKQCTEGECCVCTKEYKPVCCKGKTYGNRCEAKCAGVTRRCRRGPCKRHV